MCPSAAALAARADAHVALGAYEKAIGDCDEALKVSRTALALAIRGEAWLLSKEYPKAVEDCSEAPNKGLMTWRSRSLTRAIAAIL